MKCKNVHKLIVEFVNKELSPAQNEEIKEHLKVCSKCKEEIEEIKTVLDLSKEIKIQEFSEDFWALQRNKLTKGMLKRVINIPLKLTIALAGSFIILISFLFIQFQNHKVASYKKNSNILVLDNSILLQEEQIYEIVNFMNEEDSEIVMQMLLKN